MIPVSQSHVLSDTLGAVRRLTGGAKRVTDSTKQFPAMARLLVKWMYDYLPGDLDDIVFTSINLNTNMQEEDTGTETTWGHR